MLCQPILLTAIKYAPQSQPLLRACPPEDDTGMIHRTCLYPVKKRIQNQRERERDRQVSEEWEGVCKSSLLSCVSVLTRFL